jgi:uncharacterized phage protein (TIGR01671 family)
MNQREIKFRIRIGKTFYYFYSLDDVYEKGYFRGDRRFSDMSPQQFIGLKDQNGKDIYEGDILTISPAKFRREKIEEGIYFLDTDCPLLSPDIIYAKGVVEYNPSICAYNIRYVWRCPDWESSGVSSSQIVQNNYQYEVVGNVLENPELGKK